MCILSYLPPGAVTDTDALINGGLSNPHGHGWAIAAPGHDRILFGRSLDLNQAVEQFAAARIRIPHGHALFHSRLATHGSITVANTHPFPVARDQRVMLAHNGILPDDALPAAGEDRSDTRVLAEDLLARRWGNLDHRPTRRALATWAGQRNKLLILSVHPVHRRNAYLINAAAGVWDTQTGIWHSNHAYEHDWFGWQPSRGLHRTSPGDPADGLCPFCGSDHVDYGYCRDCGTCWDCGEFADACQCAVGHAGTRADGDDDRYETYWHHHGIGRAIS